MNRTEQEHLMLTQAIIDLAADHVAATREPVIVSGYDLLAMPLEVFLLLCPLAGYTEVPETLMCVNQDDYAVVFMFTDGETTLEPVRPAHLTVPEMN